MKTKLLCAGAALALMIGGGASAATIVQDNTQLTYKVHNTNDDDGQSLLLSTVTGSGDTAAALVVEYTVPTPQTIAQAGQGGGYAWVGAADGSFFNQVTITPESGFLGFSAFAFNFEFDNNVYGPDYGIEIDLTFSDGSTQEFDLNDDAGSPWGQPAKFWIARETGDPAYITQIFVHSFFAHEKSGPPEDRGQLGPPLPFGAIKQASFDAVFGAAPEPGAWALMILGFGGVGATLRRRRHSLA